MKGDTKKMKEKQIVYRTKDFLDYVEMYEFLDRRPGLTGGDLDTYIDEETGEYVIARNISM